MKINQQLLKTIGPGIMFAGTCIGGSHLVQSTRAGAEYGFALIAIVLVANLLKYPFFEFASRYTNATGNSILEGYQKLGKWTLWVYLMITIVSMFIITGAIIMVTSGLIGNLINIEHMQLIHWATIISILVFTLLAMGKFSILDSTLKVIGSILVVSVLVAVISALINGPRTPDPDFITKSIHLQSADGSYPGYLFLISLMGWMPIAVDMSAWHSLWTQERIKQTGYHPTLKQTLFDFNFGYIITVILAVCFLSLGAFVLYGDSDPLPTTSIAFSHKLISIFTDTIGQWSYYIIASAAFATMFGTSITLVDGYCRSMERTISLLQSKPSNQFHRRNYLAIMLLLFPIALYIVYFYTLRDTSGKPLNSFQGLIDLATATSFVIAPIAAWFNFKIILSKDIEASHRPPQWLRILAILGMIFLIGFTFFYVAVKLHLF